MGITDWRLMRRSGESREEIKATMKNAFGLDASSSLSSRHIIAALLKAWGSAVIQVKKEDETRAEARLEAPSVPSARTDHVSMRTAFERLYKD